MLRHNLKVMQSVFYEPVGYELVFGSGDKGLIQLF